LANAANEAVPDSDFNISPPSLQEVTQSVAKLQFGRAVGADGIPPQLLKCAIGPISVELHALFVKVWESEQVPAEWRDGMIIPLYKGKGLRSDCSSLRTISLWIT